jgi:hypothetical protein
VNVSLRHPWKTNFRGNLSVSTCSKIVALTKLIMSPPLDLKDGIYPGLPAFARSPWPAASEVERFAKLHVDSNAIVLSDGLACFTSIASASFKRQPVVTGGGYRCLAIPEFQWPNTVLGNVRNRHTWRLPSDWLPAFAAQSGRVLRPLQSPLRPGSQAATPGVGRCTNTAVPHRLLKMAEGC